MLRALGCPVFGDAGQSPLAPKETIRALVSSEATAARRGFGAGLCDGEEPSAELGGGSLKALCRAGE